MARSLYLVGVIWEQTKEESDNLLGELKLDRPEEQLIQQCHVLEWTVQARLICSKGGEVINTSSMLLFMVLGLTSSTHMYIELWDLFGSFKLLSRLVFFLQQTLR